jgi:hypothetical protein
LVEKWLEKLEIIWVCEYGWAINDWLRCGWCVWVIEVVMAKESRLNENIMFYQYNVIKKQIKGVGG